MFFFKREAFGDNFKNSSAPLSVISLVCQTAALPPIHITGLLVVWLTGNMVVRETYRIPLLKAVHTSSLIPILPVNWPANLMFSLIFNCLCLLVNERGRSCLRLFTRKKRHLRKDLYLNFNKAHFL
jgi:hypothetical protein